MLPPSRVQALCDSVEILTDQFLEDVADLDHGADFRNTWMAMYLPDKYLPRYDILFAKKFITCLIAVGWKLRAPEGYLLSCVAEALALNALVEHAVFIVEEQGVEADFGPFYDSAFEDTDFEVLFDLAKDGLEDSEVGRYLGMSHLHFEDWFKPFLGAYAHPYVSLPTSRDGPDSQDDAVLAWRAQGRRRVVATMDTVQPWVGHSKP